MSNWIPTAQQLPDADTEVLCYHADEGHYYLMTFVYKIDRWIDDSGHIFQKKDITHWQHLPEPPTEE